jgi:hypothetical protein
MPLITYYALFGQLASRTVPRIIPGYTSRVDTVYPNISGIKANNWLYFKAVCHVV